MIIYIIYVFIEYSPSSTSKTGSKSPTGGLPDLPDLRRVALAPWMEHNIQIQWFRKCSSFVKWSQSGINHGFRPFWTNRWSKMDRQQDLNKKRGALIHRKPRFNLYTTILKRKIGVSCII